MANLPTSNNNPGDLRDIGQVGAAQGTGGFASFQDPASGYAALLNDLQTKINNNPQHTLVDFAAQYAPPTDGNNTAQYAANLANQLGVAPNATIGSLKGKIGQFAEAVAHNEGYQGQSGQQYNAVQGGGNVQLNAPDLPSPQQPGTTQIQPSLPNVPGFAPPTPPPQNTAPASTDSNTDPGFLDDITSGIKNVANFLFPVIGDVGGLINGTNTKTPLQIAGDTALSALPFIPGLGEVGDAARGIEAVGEGAADVAPGLLAKLTGSTIAKGAAVGYGAGVASNLSQGQGVGQSLMPNINTVGGAVLGGAAPVALKGLGGLADKLSGISPQIKNALMNGGISEDEYNQYINAAKTRAGNIRAPAPLELAANQLDKASGIIDQNLSQAGKAVGAAKATLGNVKLPDITPVADAFSARVAKDYGLQLTQDPEGVVHAIPLPNRTPSIAPAEVSRIEAVAQNLAGLKGSTAQNATDVISKIDNSINYAKAATGLHPFDPIENLLGTVRSGLDDNVRSVAPDLASANDRASALYNLQREVKGMAGGTNQRGELLMKRVFSGDKSGDVQNLFGKIKNETGIDLVNHAVLAKHAIETVGDATQKSILDQMIEGGIEAHTGGIGAGLFNLGKGIARKTIANPETLGREAVTGTSGILKSSARNYGTKAAIQLSRGLLPLSGQ